MRTFKELFLEGIFSKKLSDEDQEDLDFANSFLINLARKANIQLNGKVIDKSGSWDLKVNLWQFIKEPLSLEQKSKIISFLRQYKYKQNPASDPEQIQGVMYIDNAIYTFDSGDKGGPKDLPYIKIYKENEWKHLKSTF